MESSSASAEAREDFDRFTYSSFPEAKYEAFLERYVVPFGGSFERCLDLGCGSGGLVDRLQHLSAGEMVGVDISSASIEACRARPSIPVERARFFQSDLLELDQHPELHGSFDLVVSYSVLHFVPAGTGAKLRLLHALTRPGALVALDALARIPWNGAMFGLVKTLIRTGVWSTAVRALAPVVGPSFPPEFMEELGRMTYLKHLRYADFFDLRALETPVFRERFELLRLDVVPQDGFFTGRKARLALRRT